MALFKKFLKHSFKKSNPVAKVDSSVPLLLEANDKTTSYELNIALHDWQKTFGKETKDKMMFNADDSSSNEFKVYFSPYTLECFLNYYKTLIEQEDPVPHTGGNPFKPAVTTLAIYYNTFLQGKFTKDSKGQSRPVLDSANQLKKFVGTKKHCFASDRFMSILVLLNQLIFYYNYSAAELANGDVDPSSEYKAGKQLAMFIRHAYLGEHKIPSANVATIPTYAQFERQQISAVYIPALVSPDVHQYATNPHIPNAPAHDDYAAKVRQKERAQAASLSPLAKRLKAESDSIAKANQASAKSMKSSKAPSASQQSSSSEQHAHKSTAGKKTAMQNPFVNPQDQTQPVSDSQSATTKNSQSSANMSASSQSHYASHRASMASSSSSSVNRHRAINNSNEKSEMSSQARRPIANKKSSVAATQPQKTGEDQMDLVDAHEFAKEKFPLTDKPTVIRGAVQILLDKDPNLFHIPFKFKTFKVNKHLPSPAPIQEAIRTGNIDNQQYVLESDNHYKQIVNDIINNRSAVLDMGYTRMLTDLLYGAYSKLDNKISVLLSQKMNNKPLFDSARRYYNAHYGKVYQSLAKGESVELKTVNKALFDEYMSKKRLKDNQIQQRYSKRFQEAHYKVNDLANRALYRARQQRNRELDTQIEALKDTDSRKLHLQIVQAKTEYKHRFATVGDKLSSFFYDRIQAHHEKVLEVVSNLIRKQVKLDESKADLRQAKAEVVNSKGNRQAHAKYAREQQQQQKYINELTNEINTATSKLTTLQASEAQIKNKMTAALAKNRALKGQLDNANATVAQTKQEIARGKDNLSQMTEVKAHNASLAVQASNARASYSAATSAASSNSIKASRAASASASASQALDLERQNNQSTVQQFQAQVDMLKTQASSAAQSGRMKAMSLQNLLQKETQSFNTYKASEADVKVSNQSAVSASVSRVASSAASSAKSVIAQRQNSNNAMIGSYQAQISLLAKQKSEASAQKNGSAQALQMKLNDIRSSMATYRASAASAQMSSSMAMQSAIASQASSASASASATLSARLRSHQKVESQYQDRIDKLQSQVQQATTTGQSSANSLNSELIQARASLSDFKSQATIKQASVASSVASSMAEQEELRQASATSHGNQLQQQIASYQQKLASAQANKSNNQAALNTIKQLHQSLADTKQAMSDYRTKVSNAQRQQSAISASASVSASSATAQYKAQLNSAMDNLRNASQANANTGSATAQLRMIRSTFTSYQQSVSNSNMVRSMTAKQQNAHQASSYKNQVNNLKTAFSKALQSQSQNKNSGQSKAVQSLKADYQSQLASYSDSFASYKDSVKASNTSASKSMAASNRATQEALSSATVSNATAQKDDTTTEKSQQTQQQPAEAQGYHGPEYDFSQQQSYNPHQDEVEQQRLQQMLQLKQENKQLKKNNANHTPKRKSKKAWWHL